MKPCTHTPSDFIVSMFRHPGGNTKLDEWVFNCPCNTPKSYEEAKERRETRRANGISNGAKTESISSVG
jgi:hypothetical protein